MICFVFSNIHTYCVGHRVTRCCRKNLQITQLFLHACLELTFLHYTFALLGIKWKIVCRFSIVYYYIALFAKLWNRKLEKQIIHLCMRFKEYGYQVKCKVSEMYWWWFFFQTIMEKILCQIFCSTHFERPTVKIVFVRAMIFWIIIEFFKIIWNHIWKNIGINKEIRQMITYSFLL